MLLIFNVNLFAQIEDTTNVPAVPTYPQTPTYANIAGPENVLVVYKSGDPVSTAIANYYMSARNIPAENKIGLNIPDSAVYDKGYGNYTVKLIQSGACPYIIYDNEGTVIYTVYPYTVIGGLSGSAKSYAEAGGNFLKGEYEAAKSLYNSIISGKTPDMKDYKAYEKLYVIEKLMKSAPEAFEALAGFYAAKRAESSDEMLNDFLEQLERLCSVSAEEYAGAIAEFTAVAEANLGTETAVNAEVDALTASLIASNSGLGKIIAGKYAVGGLSDYTRKLSGLLNIGKNSLNPEDDGIETPREFVLRQNYPNPFNPTTTIKYEIPERSFVELKVFDILGREVAVLQSGVKESGKYEVNFNANSLSSGVYVYWLKTADKIISKKMILLR